MIQFNTLLGRGAVMAMVTMLATLGFLFSGITVQAHEDPVNCNASGLQQFPSVGPSGVVHDGDVLTYSVIYVNSDPDGAGPVAPCNITGADATIERPDGTIINVLTDATLNVGDSISCPGGAGCAAGPYTYVVSHADETGSSVTAQFDILGILHQDADEEEASDRDTLSKTVIHPSTITSITSSDSQVVAGDTVTLTITEENDGDVNLTNASTTVDNGVGTLTSASPNFSGDDGDSILEPGETWQWTVDVVVGADTTYTATGHGTDPLGVDITFPLDQEEQDSVTVDTILPSTITTISSSESSVIAGGTVTLTVTEQNNSEGDLTNAHVDVDNGVGTLSAPPTSGDDGDGLLEPGETWSWTVSNVVVNADTTFTATGHGTINGMDVTFCADPQNPPANTICDQEEQDSVEVTVIEPTTIVSITSSAALVTLGDSVTLTITETNDGDVDLTNPFVELSPLGLNLDETSTEFTGGDAGDLGVLDPGETWTWVVTHAPAANTTYTATGHGTDPLGNDVTFPDDPEEQDSVSVEVEERDLAGCTPGYWKQSQHFDSWVGHAIGDFFDSVFGVDVTLNWSAKGKPQPVANPTLLQALGANGGGVNALARHATAALLNAANPDVDYLYSEAEIIDMVQDAVDSGDFQTAQNLLSAQNELGCPLN
jgi:uncharacterized repeat protein (TIGR01451 family)